MYKEPCNYVLEYEYMNNHFKTQFSNYKTELFATEIKYIQNNGVTFFFKRERRA